MDEQNRGGEATDGSKENGKEEGKREAHIH
jgi:hypothetical protein